MRAGTRFCRICGQSVQGNESDPQTAPLNLPGGGLQPRDTAQDTVTAAAFPALRADPRRPPPADHQPARYQPPDHQPSAYQPPDHQPGGYQAPDHQPGGYPPSGYPPPGQRPPPDGGSRRGRIIIGVLAVIVAVGGIAAGLLLARAHASSGHLAGPGHSTAAQNSGSSATGSSGAAPPTSPPPSSGTASAQQQGADNLSALLSQSVSDRGAINNAYNDVHSCGPTLTQDQATFQQAVTSRQGLLSRLGAMPDASALPAGMISSLTQAWQASITADQDFAAWAQDESASCTPGGSDANLAAATGPDNQATQDKIAFVGSWNPIAQQYDLPTYSQDQL
ncbi:MAG TPA: hypothetical protein VK586_15335 [Streptosporangiaceae bacterium]|nr:hypothetical protein [Streptosporangiaceae bacterium]